VSKHSGLVVLIHKQQCEMYPSMWEFGNRAGLKGTRANRWWWRNDPELSNAANREQGARAYRYPRDLRQDRSDRQSACCSSLAVESGVEVR
jgi:hypothetical protein